jgi:hypothetical protein
MRILCSLCLLAGFGLLAEPILAAGSNSKPKNKYANFKTGSDKNLPWKNVGFNEARKAGKPILFYVYDGSITGKNNINRAAADMELDVFTDANVKKAVADFTCVMTDMKTTAWPPNYAMMAERGMVLFILTTDGKHVASWKGSNTPRPAEVVMAASMAVKKNGPIAENQAKNPPEDWVHPSVAAQQKVARNAPAEPEVEEPEEKKPKINSLIGGGGGEEEEGKGGEVAVKGDKEDGEAKPEPKEEKKPLLIEEE